MGARTPPRGRQAERPVIAAVADVVGNDHVARMHLSIVSSPGSWDLTDRGEAARLVRTELLPR